MKSLTQSSRLLIASSLLLGFAAAHAASGFAVTPDQEKLVTTGMTVSEVKQTLGHPATTTKFMNEPGPTLSYNVVGRADPSLLFDVDFGANGRVASVSEREMDSD